MLPETVTLLLVAGNVSTTLPAAVLSVTEPEPRVIGSLKVTARLLPTDTESAPSEGVKDVGRGATVSS